MTSWVRQFRSLLIPTCAYRPSQYRPSQFLRKCAHDRTHTYTSSYTLRVHVSSAANKHKKLVPMRSVPHRTLHQLAAKNKKDQTDCSSSLAFSRRHFRLEGSRCLCPGKLWRREERIHFVAFRLTSGNYYAVADLHVNQSQRGELTCGVRVTEGYICPPSVPGKGTCAVCLCQRRGQMSSACVGLQSIPEKRTCVGGY